MKNMYLLYHKYTLVVITYDSAKIKSAPFGFADIYFLHVNYFQDHMNLSVDTDIKLWSTRVGLDEARNTLMATAP